MAGKRAALFLGRKDGGPVEFSGEGSLLTIGPPGTGKSRGVAAWNLMNYPGSLLVTDPKGELARWSAQHRKGKLGQNVAVLDPFGISGLDSASVNPLGPLVAIARGGIGVRAEAERLAHMMLPDLPSAKDPYWRAGGRSLLITALLYLATLAPQDCHLPGLHDVLWLDEEEMARDVLEPMRSHTGALRQYALNVVSMMEHREKEFGIFREEARQALSIFAADEPCGRACLSSDLDLAALIEGRLTLYLVLPPDKVASHGRWMGLVVSHAIQTIMQTRGEGECLFLLDEFPNLGRLPHILDAVAQLRSKGLRVWAFVQDLAQLEDVYGPNNAKALRHQAEVLQVLGCRDVDLAREIETRAGKHTVKTVSVGLPDPAEPEKGPRPNISEIGLEILPAAAVLEMPIGRQVLVRHGYPPLIADVALWQGG